VAAGLKPVNAVYIVGLIACGWWHGGTPGKAAMRLLWFCGAAAFGILLSYGPWGWHLWLAKGNPVFPLMNNVFRSPWRPPDSLRDERFLPHSLLDALSYPFQWAVGRFPTSEIPFRDARFALAWLLVLAGLCAMARGRTHGAPGLADRSWLRGIVLFWAFSFCIWIASFAIQRYLLPLELLSGVVIAGIVGSAFSFPVPRRTRPMAMAALTILLLATTRASDYGRLAWSGDWFDVRLPAELSRQDRMFVILSDDPVAYVIPSFPPGVRLGGNLALVPGTGLYEAAQAAIAGHKGSIASLGAAPTTARDRDLLAVFRLLPVGDRSLAVTTRIERLLCWPLGRIDSSFPRRAGTSP
jgi:hypothetical protein